MIKNFPVSLIQVIVGVALAVGLLCRGAGASSTPYSGEAVREAAPCIERLVREEMRLPPYGSSALPEITLAHEVKIEEFQDAVEPQWGFRPDVVLNVYLAKLNRIFLISDKKFYRDGRTVFDSLAHELVHFLQVKELGILPEDAGDQEEYEAVELQTRFREKWGGQVQGDDFTCPLADRARTVSR